MNKLNLPPFYAGQKVVCIKGAPEHGLHLDKIYTLSSVVRCHCGQVHCSWGLELGNSAKLICHCGSDIDSLSLNQLYCNSTRFAPIQEQNFPLMTFSKIVEKEKEEILINN